MILDLVESIETSARAQSVLCIDVAEYVADCMDIVVAMWLVCGGVLGNFLTTQQTITTLITQLLERHTKL